MDALSLVRLAKHRTQERALINLRLTSYSATVPGEKSKASLDGLPTLSFGVVVRAVGLRTLGPVGRSAFIYFIVHVMVFLFFPAVAVRASILKWAAVRVSPGFLLRAPDGTLLLGVVVDVHFSSEVLPVVSVHTSVPGMALVFFVGVGTPYGFEMEKVKVDIAFHFVEIVDRQFVFMMGKRAHIAELAGFDVIRVRLTKLRLVLFRMIKVFDGVVCSRAAVSEGTMI